MTKLGPVEVNRVSVLTYAFLIGVFLMGGFLMLPVLGLQYDEVMFAHQFWQPQDAVWRIRIGGVRIPLMMISYLGSFKTWLYAPLLAIAPGNPWFLRSPSLLSAAVGILLLAALSTRVNGRTAGFVSASLLATDSIYQMTAVFDWGPVVIQNLLLTSGLLKVMQWTSNRNPRTACLAGFLFGLALWNKALFLWNLSAMSITLVLVAYPESKRLWDRRCATFFLAGLITGASPLIAYNIGKRGKTFGENGHLTLADVPIKAAILRRTLNDQGTSTSLVDDKNRHPDQAARPFKRVALQWSYNQPGELSSGRFYAGLAFVVLGLITGTNTERKWITFFFLSGVIGWFESAITQGAGASLHHTVLFWINWYAAIAIGAACVTRIRPKITGAIVGATVVLLCLAGLRGEAATYANMLRYGPKPQWTNGDEALMVELKTNRTKRVLAADWGIANIISTESRNTIVAKEETFGLSTGHFASADFARCRWPDCVVIDHPRGTEFFPAAIKTLDASLRKAAALTTHTVTVYDTHGFPAFEVIGLKTAELK